MASEDGGRWTRGADPQNAGGDTRSLGRPRRRCQPWRTPAPPARPGFGGGRVGPRRGIVCTAHRAQVPGPPPTERLPYPRTRRRRSHPHSGGRTGVSRRPESQGCSRSSLSPRSTGEGAASSSGGTGPSQGPSSGPLPRPGCPRENSSCAIQLCQMSHVKVKLEIVFKYSVSRKDISPEICWVLRSRQEAELGCRARPRMRRGRCRAWPRGEQQGAGSHLGTVLDSTLGPAVARGVPLSQEESSSCDRKSG